MFLISWGLETEWQTEECQSFNPWECKIGEISSLECLALENVFIRIQEGVKKRETFCWQHGEVFWKIYSSFPYKPKHILLRFACSYLLQVWYFGSSGSLLWWDKGGQGFHSGNVELKCLCAETTGTCGVISCRMLSQLKLVTWNSYEACK